MARINHDRPVRIVRVGRADDDRRIGGEEIGHHLPEEAEREDPDGQRRAAQRPARIPPPLPGGSGSGWRILTPGVFDATDDSWPETRPIGLGPPRARAQSSPKHRLETPEGVRLALTSGAALQVHGGGLGHTTLEGSIEVGSDAAAGPETGQHDCWTAQPTTRILMAG